MALPNGDLITTVFDPQMAYPVERRMQVDTLNSRDSMSMFIRWEGMRVYVLEDSKLYILQGGRSNEYWKELGTGTGTGGTTFVGQFPTADLLPTNGRSAGDYAFVGTGDDFVQYNWDNIANQWVMAEGQTDMASEFFHIGYKTPLRRPVIFPLLPRDVLVQESGDFVFDPETAVARFIFVGEVTAIRGVETAASDREIKLVNRTGSDIILRDKASGIPTGSGLDFGGTDYTWVNGSEITLKGNGTYWELAPNNQVAFSDHLDSVNAQVSITTGNLEVITNLIDRYTKGSIEFKQVTEVPTIVDGIVNIFQTGKYYKRVLKEYNLAEFNILPENSATENATNFAFSQTVIPHDSKITLPTGEYQMDDVTIIKSGIYAFEGVTIVNKHEVIGNAITVSDTADFVAINGVSLRYEGIFYRSNDNGYIGPLGVEKHGIRVYNKKTVLTSCRATGFTHTGFRGDPQSQGFFLNFCFASNNGYAGCRSAGSTMQVIGGEYNENGGANWQMDGYGVVGSVGSRGDFKCIGVTALRNRTRNIDSHDGNDIIISSNTTEDAGIALPQWFNIPAPEALNIRVTQRVNRCIINGNIAKRGKLAGISVDATQSDSHLKSIVITNNILEDNWTQIIIRQLETNKVLISGNQEINNSAPNNPVNRGLLINPGTDSTGRLYIKDLKIVDNSFDTRCDINLTSYNSPIEDTTITVSGNTFNAPDSLFIYLNATKARINVINNPLIKRCEVTGTNPDSVFSYMINTQDAEHTDRTFTVATSTYAGYLMHCNNYLLNSNAPACFTVPSNSRIAYNNFINYNSNGTESASGSVLRILSGTNCEIIGNKFIPHTPVTRVMRIPVNNNNIVVKDNVHSESIRLDHSGGNTTVTKLMFDSVNKIYDFGTSSIPSLGDFVFPDGSVIKNNTGDFNRPSDWIVFNSVFIPRGFTKKGTRELTSTSVTLMAVTVDYYNVFTGNTAGGTFTVNPSVVSVGEVFEGVVLGASKTFVEGSGFTIIRPAGSSLTVNQNESFSLKFISDTQAVLNINKAIPDVPVILSTTATLDFPTIAAGETERLTATVTGAALLDPVLVSGPADIYDSNNSTVDAWVSAANTVTVRVRNNGASSIDPGSGNFKIKVFK